MICVVNPLGCDAYKVKLWHFRVLLLLLTLSAPLFITLAEAKENFYKGELVNIGSHRLHIHCEGRGSPTVIFDSGIGGFSLEWSTIQKKLAKNNLKVCSYDRAGYGWSDSGPKPRTTSRITKELKTLLTQANVPGPYLLVGHSFGGFNIRYFASEFPHLVAGLILIDSSHPQQFNTKEFGIMKPNIIKHKKNMSSFRINIIQPIIANNFPKENKIIAKILMSTNKSLKTLLDELENMETSAIQLAEHLNHDQHKFPVTIITRGMRVWPNNKLGDRREQQWVQLQYDLENISNNSVHFFAYKSGHAIHLDEPKLVIDNILLAIEKSRRSIIETELTNILSGNLTTNSIRSSFNASLSTRKAVFVGLNEKNQTEKILPVTTWSNISSITHQFDIRKVNISNDFLYIK